MKEYVIDALSGRFPKRVPNKEMLDHPGIINYVAGFDVYCDTPRAFDIAWQKLSIDIHSALPKCNAARPKVPGGTWEEDGKKFSDYGVYPTSMPIEQLSNNKNFDEQSVYDYNPANDDIDISQVAGQLREENCRFRSHFGDLAVHYQIYYTTLFMWPVMKLNWEPFMVAAARDPERFDRHFWEPWSRISRKYCEAYARIDEEIIFCHDDLAGSIGQIFSMDFYEKYIFSRYKWIWEPLLDARKKIVFITDGNIEKLLERFLDFPIDGLMFESPVTPFEKVLKTWGEAKRGFIGGISSKILTNGTPDEVEAHTGEIIEKGRKYPGFILNASGQLPSSIPMENIISYFKTRDKMGIPAKI